MGPRISQLEQAVEKVLFGQDLIASAIVKPIFFNGCFGVVAIWVPAFKHHLIDATVEFSVTFLGNAPLASLAVEVLDFDRFPASASYPASSG